MNCDHCREWHVKAAAKAGATHNDVSEAVEVGKQMREVLATAYAQFTLEVMDVASEK